jgi:GT2 family glycosyltransferase
VIVVVNGAPGEPYTALRQRFPQIHWLHAEKALGFSGAVAWGVAEARFDWVYLLNSDMTVAPHALAEAARWRAPHVFAVASQIHFADSRARREETGWTDFRTRQGVVEIFDVDPDDDTSVRGHLYAGGGASLFRRQLLQRFMSRAHPYNPVYWEDVEWGLRAWRAGYEVLFCPASEAVHIHRATVSQCFPPGEVERILRRNQLLFLLRNGFPETSPRALVRELRHGWDAKTQRELTALRQTASLFGALLRNALQPAYAIDLAHLRGKYYLRPPDPTARPTVIVVSPFAVYPPGHGSARRIANLIEQLSGDFDIVLLTDEETLHQTPRCPDARGPVAIHLTGGRVEKAGQNCGRLARVRQHSHARIRMEAQRLASVYGASLVQVEHVELAALIEKRHRGIPWVITLHDVLLTDGRQTAEDRFEAGLIAKFDAAMVCSPEDAALLAQPRPVIVPNGVPHGRESYVPSRGNHRILFLGPFRYAPNLHGIRRFLEGVYPVLRRRIPNLGLQILGGRGGRSLASQYACFDQTGVEIVDHADDVRPWLLDCALTINPLEEMRGSSIKLLESIAAGRVCVSTLEGARGFRDLQSEALVVVPRIEDFAAPLLELLSDEEHRIRIEQPAEQLLAALSWERAARIQADLYRSLIS